MRRLIVGVCGGIAAYKAVTLVRGLVKAGHDVTVIPTPHALEFVGAATWEALTGRPVAAGVFDRAREVGHVTGARGVDLIVIAPATANTLAHMRAGTAENLLTSTLLSASAPVIAFPAMHEGMWMHAATRENVAVLRARGVDIVEPDEGALSSGDVGRGRLPEPEVMLAHVEAALGRTGTLAGRHVVVSAGGTHEAIDPVRFIGNRSSGRMGCAIARAARSRGARVSLVAGPIDTALVPAGVDVHPVVSARDMARAIDELRADADVIVMAAAVADYRPAEASGTKIKKTKTDSRSEELTLSLVANPDILAGLVERRLAGQVIVGFAAETGDSRSYLELGRAKARRKGADLLAVNRVGARAGFGDVDTELTVLDPAGERVATLVGTKDEVAAELVDLAAARLA